MDYNIHNIQDNIRYETIGSEIIRHELNYVDQQKEHPIFLRAREFFLHQQWNEAKNEYEKLLSINSNNASYHNSYACILSRYGGYDAMKISRKAQKHTATAVQLEPNNMHFRLTNIQFLADLQENNKVHQQVQILFNQLFSIPLNPKIIANALEYYSEFVNNLSKSPDAVKYLSKACDVRRKFGFHVSKRVLNNLALFYLNTEQVQKSLDCISIIDQMNSTPVFEKFMSVRQNNKQQWIGCKGEIYLFVEDYEKAYWFLKHELESVKRDNLIQTHLILYADLIECCIALKQFAEAQATDKELCFIYTSDPGILELSRNINIYWRREWLLACHWMKKGGIKNAMKAVKHMEYTTENVLKFNEKKMGNRIPCAHYYLGLTYQNLSCYKSKEYYMMKAKEAFFQAANLIPTATKSLWALALVLFEGNELYLCKTYATQSWNRCKEIKRIANDYPKMKKQLKKRIKKLLCGYCGKHKYLKNKKKSNKLKVCKGCHVVYYCNTKCQKRHWKQIHCKGCSKIWIQWNKNLLKKIDNFSTFIPFNQLTSDYPLINVIA
eukprot:351947_1